MSVSGLGPYKHWFITNSALNTAQVDTLLTQFHDPDAVYAVLKDVTLGSWNAIAGTRLLKDTDEYRNVWVDISGIAAETVEWLTTLELENIVELLCQVFAYHRFPVPDSEARRFSMVWKLAQLASGKREFRLQLGEQLLDGFTEVYTLLTQGSGTLGDITRIFHPHAFLNQESGIKLSEMYARGIFVIEVKVLKPTAINN